MRIAVLSDIHGNLEALEAVLSRCADLAVDRITCLGDVVGYGADPAACTERIRDRAALVCAGNHDWAAAGRIDTEGFNRTAADAIAWTRRQLTDAQKAWLSALPLTERQDDTLFVHGSPFEPAEFHYIFGASDASLALSETDARIVFVGHSHRAFVYREADRGIVTDDGVPVSTDRGRLLVNVGSVGQPRDQDARASFCFWDTDRDALQLDRVSYDVSLAQQKIIRSGLPESLAYRLGPGS